MKVRVNHNDIKQAVSGFRKIACRHIPGTVHIESGTDGLTLSMSNGDERLIYTAEDAEVQVTGTTAVELDGLSQYVKTRGRGETVIDATGDAAVIRRCVQGNTEVEYLLVAAGMPEYDVLPSKGVPADNDFLPVLHQALTFASKDGTRAVLCGAYLDVSQPDHRMVCTDGRRLSAFKTSLPIRSNAIIPASRFLSWSMLRGATFVAVKDKTFRLDVGPWVYTAKCVEGAFPNWRTIVPSEGANRLRLSDKQHAELIKLLPELPGAKDAAVALCKRNGQLVVCSGAAPNRNGWTAARVGVREGSDDCPPVFVDRTYLLDALNCGFRSFSSASERAPLVSHTEAGHIHVLMPVQCSEQDCEQVEKVTAVFAGVRESTKRSTNEEARNLMKGEPMTEQKEQQPATAIERLQETYKVARDRVKDANSALADLAVLLRDVAKEDKQRRSEIKQVRAGLSKLQSIHV